MKKKQKDVFLDSEANAWFERNHAVIQKKNFGKDDPIVQAIYSCMDADSQEVGGGKLLEVGCGEGKRLHWITENLNLQCYGVDPSKKAVSVARKKTVHVIQGTADQLDFEDQSFDFLVFGFCLYLCDREDLFRIASEAHRVLKPNSWLVVHDFFADKPVANEYSHFPGISSYKMDYRKLFDWHPDYACFFHSIKAHGLSAYTDDQDEWVSTSIIRKKGKN